MKLAGMAGLPVERKDKEKGWARLAGQPTPCPKDSTMISISNPGVAFQPPPEVITRSIDSEFHPTHTLTVPAAARLDEHTLPIQIDRTTDIPDLPEDWSVKNDSSPSTRKDKRYERSEK